MRVALFITCFNDTLFPGVGIATTRLLERLGHTLAFPEAQTCCGQMHYNTGYQREAIPLARHFVETFADADVIVAPSASCVGMVRDLYRTPFEWHFVRHWHVADPRDGQLTDPDRTGKGQWLRRNCLQTARRA